MMRYPYIQVDIYESESFPVVTHIFRGTTKKQAQGIMNAHMSTDKFLRDALNKQNFDGRGYVGRGGVRWEKYFKNKTLKNISRY